MRDRVSEPFVLTFNPTRPVPHVSELYMHPVKSAAAIAVSELELDLCGAVHDRRWMLVDKDGVFLTQRKHGTLALIVPEVQGRALLLRSNANRQPLRKILVSPPRIHLPPTRAVVWDDEVLVHDAGNAAAEWCSAVVGVPCRLVCIAPQAMRPLKPKYAGSVNSEGRTVALSDGAPLLIIGENSLHHLNERLVAKGVPAVGMNRFRPNVVLSGTSPHEEDTWRTIRIGEVEFGVGSPCLRCVMTTIDQNTGRRAPQQENEEGGEPLRTLASYRRQDAGVIFGMNVTNATTGHIRVGDRVTVVTRSE